MEYVPPWKEPYFIAIAGCSGSGKTSVTSSIIQKLNLPWTIILSMDNFYRPLSEDQRKLAFASNWDFDSPEAIDFDQVVEVLQSIKQGRKTDVPVYSFKEHQRLSKTTTIYGANVVILEGIYSLYDKRVLDLIDLKVFVQEDYDVCMARRLHRDILHRGRELEPSILQWERFVKPNFIKNIQPTEKEADIIIPNGFENKIALDLLLTDIRLRLRTKSAQHLAELAKLGRNSDEDIQRLVFLPQYSTQLNAIHTIVLNSKTPRADFVFYFNRMADILVSLALEAVFESDVRAKEIVTPLNQVFKGVHLPFEKICAVTMVRGGECFETVLKASVPTVSLGRLLIQRNTKTGEPELHMCRLPPSLTESPGSFKVLLTDSQVLSGAAAVMAVQILVDHGVSQEDIILVIYSSSEIGIRRLHAAFPKIKVVVGRVSPTILNSDIDKLYFGT